MNEQWKQEIIVELQSIYDNYVLAEWETEPTMFGPISRYISTGNNIELIGGDWLAVNCPEPLKNLRERCSQNNFIYDIIIPN